MDVDILVYLNDNYCAEYIELREFIFGKFVQEGKSVYLHIVDTLNALAREHLIRLEKTDYIEIGEMITTPGYSQTAREQLTFAKFIELDKKIPAKITLKAKLLVEQKRFNDQLDRTNKAIEASSNSSISTNRSFQILNEQVIPSFNRRQIILGNRTMLIAAISAIAIMATVYVANKGVTSEDIKSINKQLQNNTQVLDSMRQYQKSIRSSLEKEVNDSFYRK